MASRRKVSWASVALAVSLGLVLAVGVAATVLLHATARPPPQPLRLGLLVWPSYELAYLAEEKGYFDPKTVKIVDYVTPADLVRDYETGVVDVMALTGDFLIALNARGSVAHRAIMAIDFSHGGDTIVARAGLDSVGGLRGKRIGVELGSLGLYVLERALELDGVRRDEVTVVPLDLGDQADAFAAGKVDAVVTFQPTTSRLVAQGGRVIFDSTRIPGEIIDVLVAPEATIRSRGPELRALVRGWLKAVTECAKDDNLAIMARRESLDPPAFAKALQGLELLDATDNRALLSGRDERLIAALDRVQTFMKKQDMISGTVDVHRLIEPDLVPEGEP